jgi:r-opsin
LGCQIHAFCGALFGYVQIVTLVFISYDRFNVIVNGFNATALTYCKVFLILTFIYAYSIAWAVAPLYGFGAYALDGILTE